MPRRINSLRAENNYFRWKVTSSESLWGFIDYDEIDIEEIEHEYLSPLFLVLHYNHPTSLMLSRSPPQMIPTTSTLHNSRTTSTETPSSTGVYSEYVYFDWGTNWDRVSELVFTNEVQDVLKKIIIDNSNDRNLLEWREKTKWPLLYSPELNDNVFLQAALRKYLPRDFVCMMNSRIANWYNAVGNKLIKEERVSIDDKEDELHSCLLYEIKSGQKVYDLITTLYEKELFKADGNLREILLCAPKETDVFVPFLHELARKLSPPSTKLAIVNLKKQGYSVVVDTERKIVFDNFHYFLFPYSNESAKLLKKLKRLNKYSITHRA